MSPAPFTDADMYGNEATFQAMNSCLVILFQALDQLTQEVAQKFSEAKLSSTIGKSVACRSKPLLKDVGDQWLQHVKVTQNSG